MKTKRRAKRSMKKGLWNPEIEALLDRRLGVTVAQAIAALENRSARGVTGGGGS